MSEDTPTTTRFRLPPQGTPATLTSTAVQSQTLPPRVGGVIPDGGQGEPWTGGSNLVAKLAPTYLTQRRPYKYAASQSLLTKIEAGTTEKLGASDETATCSFEHWMRLQAHHHIKMGMDTPFLMPNEDWTEEVNLFECFNKNLSDVKPWIDQLKRDGITKPDGTTIQVCPYDVQNLEYSALFILGSLTTKFRSEVEHSIGLSATGIEVLLCIIERKYSLQVSLQRELVAKLEQLDIIQEPGENISTFNVKVKNLCQSIEFCGPAPRDLNTIVIGCFINCSVVIFSQYVNASYFQATTNPEKFPWRDTLLTHESMYFRFKKIWTPESSKPVTNKEFQTYVKSQQTKMNQLQVKKEKDTTKTICYDCGKPGVKVGHEGCTQSGKKLHVPKKDGNARGNGNAGRGDRNQNSGRGRGCGNAGRGGNQNNNRQGKPPADAPKPGEPEVRMRNGVEEKYCTKCRFPQWRSGDKAHTTSEHRNPSENKQANFVIAEVAKPPVVVLNVTDTTELVQEKQEHGAFILQPVPEPFVDNNPASNPTQILSLNPGLMYSDGDDETTLHFNLSLSPAEEIDEDDSMFHEVAFDLDPAIKAQLDANSSTEVCNDDETYYDAVSTFSEGDNKDCSSTPTSTYQHIFQFFAMLSYVLFTYSNPRLSLSALLVFSLCVGSYGSFSYVLASKFIKNSVVKDKINFAYPAVYMILSCVMLTMHFVQMLWRVVSIKPFVTQWMSLLAKLFSRKNKKPPIVTNNYTNDIKTNLRRLCIGLFYQCVALFANNMWSSRSFFSSTDEEKAKFHGFC